MDTNYFVREAVPSDAKAIASINILSWQENYKNFIDQTFLNSLAIPSRVIGAAKRIDRKDLNCIVAVDKVSQKVLGFADFGPSRDGTVEADAELYAIYVDKGAQFQGIGQQLFLSGFKLTKARGYKKLFVSVFEFNSNARAFYEKMGGRILGSSCVELGGIKYKSLNYSWTF
jgi:ribosomal protein S18 acetylase RimI-like enzyme